MKECRSQRDSGMPGPQRARQRQPKLVQGSDLRERRDIGPKTGLAGCDARYVWGLLGVCSAIQRPEKVGGGDDKLYSGVFFGGFFPCFLYFHFALSYSDNAEPCICVSIASLRIKTTTICLHRCSIAVKTQ